LFPHQKIEEQPKKSIKEYILFPPQEIEEQPKKSIKEYMMME